MADKYIDLSYNTPPSSAESKTIDANITGATAANPVVITAVAHGFEDNDIVDMLSLGGMVELNNRTFIVANKTDDTFELSGENGTGHTAYTSGGLAHKRLFVSGDVRLMYDDTLPANRIFNAANRLKMALTKIL